MALAEPSALRIEPPERLRVADRGEVVVEVAGVDASLPVLLSIDTEGEAVAAVRARITRSEAEVLANGHLRFRAPILARSQGTAVLLVRSLGYACEGQRCQARRAEARVVLRVEGR